MTKLLQRIRSQAGFTMIELLVVIAVIGVLAVAVLSAINPIEQINKGRDTRSRSDAAQLISATDRYFAIHERYPWNEAAEGPAGSFASGWEYTPASVDYRDSFTFEEATATQDEDWGWILPLINTAEIKEAFGSRITNVTDNTNFFVTKDTGANRTMYVCFEPSSYSFDQEATNRCAEDTQLPDGACPTDCTETINDDNRCMVCLP